MSSSIPRQGKLFEEDAESESMSKSEGKRKGEQECAFCAIVKGERDTRHIVFEDSVSLAFLDRRPVFLGHCLLIPLRHYETLNDLPKNLVGPIFSNIQMLAGAVEIGLHADGAFIAINNRISQSVPHLHIHLIPRKSGDGLRGFFWPRQKYQSGEQAEEIANSIRSAIAKILPKQG